MVAVAAVPARPALVYVLRTYSVEHVRVSTKGRGLAVVAVAAAEQVAVAVLAAVAVGHLLVFWWWRVPLHSTAFAS